MDYRYSEMKENFEKERKRGISRKEAEKLKELFRAEDK